MKRLMTLAMIAAVMFSSCSNKKNQTEEVALTPIMEKALNDANSKFYADFPSFPAQKNKLPIGVFDSGTGGLTVLEVLLKADMVDNISGNINGDGVPDFAGEDFVYLADRANMPYGNYAAENKQDFFRELVVKDALFLLGDNYWLNPADKEIAGEKLPCKILVIACNTATAWGLEDVSVLLEKSGTGVKVIGVINAGVNALYDKINASGKTDSLAVGVLATVGTIASNAYERTIREIGAENGYQGYIKVVNHPCAGFAESVDQEKDFVNVALTAPREGYRGPKLGTGEEDIKEGLLRTYNFDYGNGAILREKVNGKYTQFQLNSAANYARFHLVSLLEKHKASGAQIPLKHIILGCTHYPFLLDTLNEAIEELRNFRDQEGRLVYEGLIHPDFEFIDPAVFTALECYRTLREDNNLALNTTEGKFEGYISVPAYGLPYECVDEDGNLTYDFKYGRNHGTEDITTVFVPFSKRYLDEQTLGRIESMLPVSYGKIQQVIE